MSQETEFRKASESFYKWEKLRCTDPELLQAFKIRNNEEFRTVVDLMRQCWDIEPSHRPKFRQILRDLESVNCDYDYDTTHY